MIAAETEQQSTRRPRARRGVHCPACGQSGCELIRDYGKGIHADYECGCGWRFRADREGNVLREFGYSA